MEAKWTVYGKRADFTSISNQFHIDQVIARVIRNRDIIGEEAIEKYLHGTLKDTYDGALMKDMDKGCQLIMDSINQGKMIRVIADYDVDGVMSGYILTDGLKALGANVTCEIPHRMKDGYGINERLINKAKDDGIDTIITCDNGIAAFDAIKLAKDYGMTVVVTDHHEIPYDVDEDGNRIPKIVPADAVIDIKREDCTYPFKGLCGAGVAYKFLQCLYRVMNVSWEDTNKYLEFLGLATVCDVMDLVDENRIFVKYGLKQMEKTKNLGFRALLAASELTYKELAPYHFGFVIGPCVNAVGRLGDAMDALALFTCEDEQMASQMASTMYGLNVKRKAMTEEGVERAFAIVRENYMDQNVLVIYIPGLHESLAGIVAGKVKEEFYRPTLVFTDASDESLVKGSGRSIEGYHLYDALHEVDALLSKYGGHELAAGVSLEKDNLDELRIQLNAKEHMTEDVLTPMVRLDVAMPISYINEKLIGDLSVLEPFGKKNEKPLFGQSGLRVKRASLFGSANQYARFVFMDDQGFSIEAVDFNGNTIIENIKMWFGEEECAKMFKGVSNDVCLDVAYYPELNEYRGRKSIQIRPTIYRKHNA